MTSQSRSKAPHQEKGDPKPNILLILTDDHGWPYYGMMDHPIDAVLRAKGGALTPRLDALAAEGIVFSQGYVTAAHCQPSHRSTLTGLNLRDINDAEIGSASCPTIPQRLKEPRFGYRTRGSGKWWLGKTSSFFTDNKNNLTYLHFIREPDGAGKGLKPHFDFIDDCESKNTPWFWFCAPNLPHYPLSPPAEFLDGLEGVDYRDPRYSTVFGLEGSMRYYGNIRWLDSRIGQIVDYLKPIRKKTLILCLTDNGAGPKLAKAHFTEAGLRTPIIANLPGTIPATGHSSALVGCIDLYSTVLDYAGGPPADDVSRLVDSRSARMLAQGKTSASRRVFFGNWKIDGERSVRDARYKLYCDKSGKKPRVIDLQTLERHADPEVNIIGTRDGQQAFHRLEPILQAWWDRNYAGLDELIDSQLRKFPLAMAASA